MERGRKEGHVEVYTVSITHQHSNPVLDLQSCYKFAFVQFNRAALCLVAVEWWRTAASVVPASRHTWEALTITGTVWIVSVTLNPSLGRAKE